jgi:hypothetical protein
MKMDSVLSDQSYSGQCLIKLINNVKGYKKWQIERRMKNYKKEKKYPWFKYDYYDKMAKIYYKKKWKKYQKKSRKKYKSL